MLHLLSVTVPFDLIPFRSVYHKTLHLPEHALIVPLVIETFASENQNYNTLKRNTLIFLTLPLVKKDSGCSGKKNDRYKENKTSHNLRVSHC